MSKSASNYGLLLVPAAGLNTGGVTNTMFGLVLQIALAVSVAVVAVSLSLNAASD